jgi:hypothetical protein
LDKNRNNFNEIQLKEWFYEFNRCYKYSGSYNFNVKRQYSVGNKEIRLCRYCGKGKPEVEFKKNAHLIPKFLGNRLIRCYYECDNCNELFGKYETDLSNYIGIRGYLLPPDRVGVERSRVFKSKNGTALFYISKRGIEISDLNKEMFEELPDNKGFKCIAKKDPFVPLNVYKSLVKISLATLIGEVLVRFKKTLVFLTSDNFDKDKSLKIVAQISALSISDLYFNSPIIYTFTKRMNIHCEYEIPNLTFILFFKKFCYQLFIPFDINDNFIRGDKIKAILPLYPPIIANKDYSKCKLYPEYYHELVDLSSTIREKDASDEFYIINKSAPILLSYSETERDELKRKYGLRK